MTLSMIHVKTAKGMAEVKSRSNALSPVARRVLIMIDGRRSEADLAPVVRDGELETILATLRSLGMIEECGVVDLPPPAPAEADDEQTVMEVPPTLRLELGIAPLRAAAAAAPPPPPTLRVPFDLRPGTLGATPSPLVERRTPPNAAPPPPAPAVAAAPATQAAAALSADVVRGAATAPMVTPAMQPVQRVLPPVNTTPALRRVVVAPPPPPPPAQAEVAPPPAPAPAPPPASFEETKRAAVRALYERLGPYGEEPAARLQDCKSLDALREQIAHAGKRISTFRGEAAARDYLAGLGLS